ncbi:protein phosphatase 2C domain-containing protein [Streptomyces sp. NPDC048436]|uniref:protein phosphatase 2C domain-containing protein n=1 Tax=Streptomyces sp. NPDC048436 TaxID=3365550 RepID=UPI00371A8740
MSQQGERHDGTSGQEDDWWGQLYDDSAHDTGPAEVADTLDDRFASAVSAAGSAPDVPSEAVEPPPRDAPPGPREPYVHREPPSTGEPPGPGEPSGPVEREGPREPYVRPERPPAEAAAPGDRTPSGAWGGGPLPPAPWEPPSTPPGPVTFPGGVKPSGGASEAGPSSRTTAVPAPRLPDASAAPRVQPQEQPPEAGLPDVPDGVSYVGDGPPTYDAEPTVLPAADPDDLGDLVADTVLDGARYGTSTLRAVSVRGDSARYRGEPRRDSLLTARFGSGDSALVLVAMATGARATPGAHRAAAEACAWIGRAVGRSHQRLSEDIRAARRGDLKSGLHRLTDRSLGKLRAQAADLGIEPEEYAASLRCLLLPADPECRTRVFFGVGGGGLFRLRDGAWQDIEPRVSDTAVDAGPPVVGFGSVPPETPEGDRLTMDMGIITPPSPYEPAPEPPPREPFRFRASVARPGDALMLCSGGLAEPLRGEPELAAHLTQRWTKSGPPGLATFLADIQVRVKGYADDRTAAAVWEA